MKKRILLLVTLLLMCGLILLQEAPAERIIEIYDGDDQDGYTGEELWVEFIVEVWDDDTYDPYPNIEVTFSIIEEPPDAGASLSKTSVLTDEDGFADSTLTLGNAIGIYKVEASIGNTDYDKVVFTVTAIPTLNGVTLEGVGNLSQTTETTDTADVTYTLRVTNIGSVRDTIDLVCSITTATVNPTQVRPNAGAHQDVVLTVPRSALTNPNDYEVSVTATSQADPRQTDTVITTTTVYIPTAYGVVLAGVGSLTQTTKTVNTADVTYTLRVINIGETSDTMNLKVSGDINSATVNPTSVALAVDASQNVVLTVPRSALTNPNDYEVTVTATSQGDTTKTDTITTTTTVIIPGTYAIALAGVGSLTQTITTDATADVTYILRVSNIGTTSNKIDLTMSGDVATATLSATLVPLDAGASQNVILTVPWATLAAVGTYDVTVKGTSQGDTTETEKITATTIVTSGPSSDTPTPDTPTPDTPTPDTPTPDTPTPDTPTPDTQPDQSLKTVVFSEFMFESAGGENGLPQWIEVYNNSTKEVNLNGWKLHWKHLQPIPFEVTITFKEDFIIPVEQSRLIVTSLGRHSGGAKLSDDAVYQLHHLHAEELTREDIEIRNRLIDRGGFSLKLINPNDVIIDHIGTLTGNKQTWQLHECLVNGVRTSLIRRFDEGVPRSGTERRGWRRAFDAKRLIAGIYYGHSHDLGTPAYRRGKPLPVELSQFSARFVKDKVVINWTTESELNNAGFNILRSTSRTKNFRPINTKLVKGAGTTGERNTYQFIDKTAKPNVAYYYRIEDVDFSGTREILTTYQLRGVIAPTGKAITTWGTLKDDR